jgi:hypothetical protein
MSMPTWLIQMQKWLYCPLSSSYFLQPGSLEKWLKQLLDYILHMRYLHATPNKKHFFAEVCYLHSWQFYVLFL